MTVHPPKSTGVICSTCHVTATSVRPGPAAKESLLLTQESVILQTWKDAKYFQQYFRRLARNLSPMTEFHSHRKFVLSLERERMWLPDRVTPESVDATRGVKSGSGCVSR